MSPRGRARPRCGAAVVGARTARAVAGALLLLGAAAAHAQVTVTPPTGNALRGDTLRSVTPTFVVQVPDIPAGSPLRVRFQIASTREFRVPLLFDTLFTAVERTIPLAPGAALPQDAQIWWRAIVIDPSGVERSSATGGPLRVPPWVTTVSPPDRPFQPVRTRRPTFVWRSPAVNEPPGPWEYTLRVISAGELVINVTTRDTAYTLTERQRLEANAPYQWEITARLPRTVQGTVVPHPVSFVVEDPAVPTSTLLYQNFPNPFPTPLTDFTCIWFDLGRPATVRLDVYDLRGLHVRRLLPANGRDGTRPAGRYGREASEANEGCDRTTGWDGRDDGGRVVPPGVYLLRFQADGVTSVKKIVFRGAP